ncbi:MAG: hypothetical protein ACKO5Z_08470 [Burkholderiaceae bacterium]
MDSLPNTSINTQDSRPQQLVGLLVAFVGMIAGSLAPQWAGRQTEQALA